MNEICRGNSLKVCFLLCLCGCALERRCETQLNAYTYNARAVPVTSYVAQLVPLPKELAVQERVAMHTVLRAPINSMRHADLFPSARIRRSQIKIPNGILCLCFIPHGRQDHPQMASMDKAVRHSRHGIPSDKTVHRGGPYHQCVGLDPYCN